MTAGVYDVERSATPNSEQIIVPHVAIGVEYLSPVDGTGASAFTGDVAIDAAEIAQVGGKAGPAKREIDANGLLVTTGWVDVHTHYDGQATWDPVLAPSSWHGVTTILFGNCGLGFAPVRREHRAGLIDLMEAIEDIPGTERAG